uniref:Putative DNA binding, helix-turn-helix domain containing protein n=1 Tax=viral metagenome TaxID=1070528 RepID=A0A6M3LNI1_9ZZZZ
MAKRWTEKEIEFLLNNCGIMSNKRIADRLNRSHHAIRQKLHICGVSVFSNFYSARMLATELGKSHKTIMRWYRKGYIKGKVAEFGRGYLNPPMIFLEQDIVIFLRKYHYLFNKKKISHLYFRNIVKSSMG